MIAGSTRRCATIARIRPVSRPPSRCSLVPSSCCSLCLCRRAPRARHHRVRRLRRVITAAALVRQVRSRRHGSPRRRLLTRHPPRDLHRARQLWARAGTGRVHVPRGARTIAPGGWDLALATTYLARPLVLVLPSASSAGPRSWGRPMRGNTAAFRSDSTDSLEVDLRPPLHHLPYGDRSLGHRLAALDPVVVHRSRDTRIGVTLALLLWHEPLTSEPLRARVPTADSSAFAGHVPSSRPYFRGVMARRPLRGKRRTPARASGARPALGIRASALRWSWLARSRPLEPTSRRPPRAARAPHVRSAALARVDAG